MSKSIETMWKEGFLTQGTVLAPRVNKLYEQKSHHVVDKFQRTFKWNHYYVILLAAIHFGIGFLVGLPILGAMWMLLFLPLILATIKHRKLLSDIDKTVNSYEYLTSFQSWLKMALKNYGSIYSLFYPVYFLIFSLIGSFMTRMGPQPLDNSLYQYLKADADAYLVAGQPLFLILGIGLIVALAAVFARKLYELDLGIIYGRMIDKLEELISDMELLRSDDGALK